VDLGSPNPRAAPADHHSEDTITGQQGGRRPVTFKQRDVRAAVKAAFDAGATTARVEIDGRFIIVASKSGQAPDGRPNSFDRILGEQN
jgi:hypothetical protein